MAYSHAWDETQPLGSAAASTIDDIIRQFKVDVRERMNSIVVDWTADPVVFKGAIGKQMLLAPSSLVLQGFVQSYIQSAGANYVALQGPGVLPIPVVVGWLVKRIEIIIDRSAVSSISISTQTRLFSTSPGGSGYGTTVYTNTGITLVTLYNSTGISIDVDKMLDVYFNPIDGGQWNFYGARITYDIQ